ncbi:hypothetical protein M9Y10_011120 [Tritrichomonas musculus]|uniref:Uncharacterized protein n=1 Tax=Tritrichomonas musculus TaxID=1915356 RepID=A0ABR2IQ39_9EUKA
MNASCCTCTCGNVKISGQIVPQFIHHNTASNGKSCNRLPGNFLLINSQSIEIQNFKKIKGCLLNKSVSNVKCTACGATFKFHKCNKNTYLEYSGPLRLSQKQSAVQNNVSKQNKNNNENQCFNLDRNIIENKYNEDCDFEYMFSNKDDPIVGSYKSYMDDPLSDAFFYQNNNSV